jgi:hypothetical protein
MSDERKIIRQPRFTALWNGRGCPFCGRDDGYNVEICRTTIDGRKIIVFPHKACFEQAFATQEGC